MDVQQDLGAPEGAAALREVERDTVRGVGTHRRDLDRLAGNDHVDDLAVGEQPRRRLVTGHEQEFFRSEAERVRERVGARRRMEHAELRGRPRHEIPAQDADATGGRPVAIQVFVAPDLGALVQPRSSAVGVVPVREQDGWDLDLPADRAFERLAHFRSGLSYKSLTVIDPARLRTIADGG